MAGMLEGFDMKRMDMISTFLGAFMDRVIDESKTCRIMSMFTDLVDIMRDVCGITKRDKWKDEKLSNIAERIKPFKRNRVYNFGTFQKSGMCTVKWHVSDHNCADIKRNGSIFLCSADLFEYECNIFKKEYRKTSKRHAMVTA